MKRILFPIVLIAQLVILAGCTSTPEDLTGKTLSPIPINQVMLYPKKPSNYAIVGNIALEVTPELNWDSSGQADKAFDATRTIAASMGANGILYEIDASKYDFLATASYHGASFQIPIRGTKSHRTIVLQAILVKPN
jgi:hypothetical protein